MEAVQETNEPTYCVCQQVSYGEMIACDNEEVPNLSTIKLYPNLNFSVKLSGFIMLVLDFPPFLKVLGIVTTASQRRYHLSQFFKLNDFI